MTIQNLGGFKKIEDLIAHKLTAFEKEKTSFAALFNLMFSERENVLAEYSDGYRIKKVTYGETYEKVKALAIALQEALQDKPKNSIVGLSMSNGLPWIETLWAILAAGYKPLLINTRLHESALEGILTEYSVAAVISDGKKYDACETIVYSQLTLPIVSKTEFTFGTEILFMSSGTTGEAKLCAYSAEQMFYQLRSTYGIVKECPKIRTGYEGEIKQLALLPFYHVFGFIAVYLWFAFFSRTFVFLKDLQPQTLLNTVKKHKVTHIFAVPLVWETIYKTAMSKIKAKGEKTYNKVQKGLKLANGGAFGKALTRKAFGEVREQIFGDSVCFMISGGSSISREAFYFLNGIGYHIANGYGMTEVGITSVNLDMDSKSLNSLSIGKPFTEVEYRIENGELQIRGKTRAARILQGGVETQVDHDEWFATNDLAREENGSYFIEGRRDDLIIGVSGENINPNLSEAAMQIQGADEKCLFKSVQGEIVLLISAKRCFSADDYNAVYDSATQAIKACKLEGEVQKIAVTCDPLLEGNDFKVSRQKIAKRYAQGEFRLLSADSELSQEVLSRLETDVQAMVASVLGKSPDEIGVTANFFLELGGTSLDYFALADEVKNKFNASLPYENGETLATVKAICQFLKNNGDVGVNG